MLILGWLRWIPNEVMFHLKIFKSQESLRKNSHLMPSMTGSKTSLWASYGFNFLKINLLYSYWVYFWTDIFVWKLMLQCILSNQKSKTVFSHVRKKFHPANWYNDDISENSPTASHRCPLQLYKILIRKFLIFSSIQRDLYEESFRTLVESVLGGYNGKIHLWLMLGYVW